MSARRGNSLEVLRSAASWRSSAQWVALLTLSAIISLIWGAAGLPAALLLGPMISGIAFGVNGLRPPTPRLLYLVAQGLLGAMIASSITPPIVASFIHDAPLFCLVIAATVLGAAAIGWLISRSGLIPGATAIYGTSPGAATAMVLLGEAEGADASLVAFMQYSRVLLVALCAALVAHLWSGPAGAHVPHAPWLAPVQWENLAAVLLLVALGQQAARLLRLPAWALLGPMLLLSALHAGGGVNIQLPRWLLAGAYAVIGWHIGLGFSREALRHAGKTLPVVAVAAICLMSFCGLLAWGLMRLAHVDALTAYLATSPGGLDTVAIIAASTPRVDLSFVLGMQSMRLLFVIGLAPLITRLVVRHSGHLQAPKN
jgi:membrane AbrB-like protein